VAGEFMMKLHGLLEHDFISRMITALSSDPPLIKPFPNSFGRANFFL
jgi:hypothetical protein